ncbi:MAG: lactococcin family bacteriocin [Lactococcus lactis]
MQYIMSAGPYTWYKDTRTGKTICKQTIDTASYTFGVMAEGWGKTFH